MIPFYSGVKGVTNSCCNRLLDTPDKTGENQPIGTPKDQCAHPNLATHHMDPIHRPTFMAPTRPIETQPLTRGRGVHDR